ncbi:uncharacterized protein LOC135438073 isoform X3 [Drosophila montana]|uniref:uncharacterized protein LOC135438073 isoform X3 n=1 Tax=Drosophila montana TaxID=40370 RepID=UPI00313C91B2
MNVDIQIGSHLVQTRDSKRLSPPACYYHIAINQVNKRTYDAHEYKPQFKCNGLFENTATQIGTLRVPWSLPLD